MPATSTTNADNSADDHDGLLQEILTLAHPMMADAIYLAAIPHWYDAAFYAAIRAIDDNRNEGLVVRLEHYSFVITTTAEQTPIYRVRTSERLQLHYLWIDRDRATYRTAHQRAFNFLATDRATSVEIDNPAHEYERLYHLFFIDLAQAIAELIRLFRRYSSERRLAAIEYLLDGVEEARHLLSYLDDSARPSNGSGPSSPSTPPQSGLGGLLALTQLQTHMRARLAQIRGEWDESRTLLLALRRTPQLVRELRPYIGRAYAAILTREGNFVQAIHEYEVAIKQFATVPAENVISRQRSHEIERAMTLLSLGETYVSFACSLTGENKHVSLKTGLMRHLQSLVDFIISLPLVFYFSLSMGTRVWHPQFWPTLFGMDWVVGRLFALAAQQFQQADRILKVHGTPEESILADEKLAFLFLEMGDFIRARQQFQALLTTTKAPLGSYRRLLVQLGLAESEVRLNQWAAALTPLQELIPRLRSYNDRPNLARAQALRAEANFLSCNYEQAQNAMGAALREYRELNEFVDATNLQERMEGLAGNRTVPPPVRAAIRGQAAVLPQRHYGAAYQHPGFVIFRQIALLLIPLAMIFVFLNTIQLTTEIQLAPSFSFRAAPILDPDATEPTQLSQGVTDATLAINVNPRSFLVVGLVSFLVYLLGFALLGVWIILDTSLFAVQQRSQNRLLCLDAEGISIGTAVVQRRVQWKQIIQVSPSNISFWRRPLPSVSSLSLKIAVPPQEETLESNVGTAAEGVGAPTHPKGKEEWIKIDGNTNWYSVVQRQIYRASPPTVQRHILSYSIFRSLSGLLYLVNYTLLLLIALLANSDVWGPLLWYDLLGTPYSVVDLYPYLYLGLVLVPLWWSIVLPSHIIRHSHRQMRFTTYSLITAFGLAIFHLSRSFGPLLTIPDLYPPLIILTMIGSAAWSLWQWDFRTQRNAAVRNAATVALCGLLAIFLLSFALRDIAAYHFLIYADTARERARQYQNNGDVEAAVRSFAQSQHAYERVIQISERPLWGIDPRQTLQKPSGIPAKESFPWLLAMQNLAALHVQTGDGSQAAELYTELLQYFDQPEQVYTWRAMARQKAATQIMVNKNQTVQIDQKWYENALDDYERALTIIAQEEKAVLTQAERNAVALRKAQYLLWRGFTSHSLAKLTAARADYIEVLRLTTSIDDQSSQQEITATFTKLRERALSGLGWLAYNEAIKAPEEEQPNLLTEAEQYFATAVTTNATEPEAWLGLGYARYSLGALKEDASLLHRAEVAWLQARTLDPRDPTVRISLGTLHWKLAWLESGAAGKCAEYSEAIKQFATATDRRQLRFQGNGDLAYTYRTMGFIYFELRNCAVDVGNGYAAKTDVFQSAIDSFTNAIRLVPTEGSYHQLHGRYRYALWLAQTDDHKDFDLLYGALADLQRAADLGNPATAFMNATLDTLAPYALQQAKTALAAGKLNAVREQLSLVVTHRPTMMADALTILNDALVAPTPLLVNGPTTKPTEFIYELHKMITDLLILNPAWFFHEGVNALVDGQPGTAMGYFENGLKHIRTQSALDSALDHLHFVQSLQVHAQAKANILRDYRSALPQLEATFADKPTVSALITLGSLAALLDDTERAGRLYATALQQNTEHDNQEYATLRGVFPPLLRHWQVTPSNASALLSALDDQLAAQLQATPSLANADYYWGVRAWFKYWIGRSAFRARDEQAARQALASGQQDANRAFANDQWEGGDEAHTYLAEGAWAWYHVERGDDAWTVGDRHAAFADYLAAVYSSSANTNRVARNEKLQAMSKLALAYLALGSEWMAANTYQDLLLQSATFADQEGAVEAGRALDDYLLEHPLIAVNLLYTKIIVMEPALERINSNAHPALYWRHRAEFGFNVVKQLFLARPEEARTFLPIIDQTIVDLQRAANLDPATHAERSEAFTLGIVGSLYGQLGNQEFESGNYIVAQNAYEHAINQTTPQGHFATEVLIDTHLRAALTALYLDDGSNSTAHFDQALSLLKQEPSLQNYKEVIETLLGDLAQFTSTDEQLLRIRNKIEIDLKRILEK